MHTRLNTVQFDPQIRGLQYLELHGVAGLITASRGAFALSALWLSGINQPQIALRRPQTIARSAVRALRIFPRPGASITAWKGAEACIFAKIMGYRDGVELPLQYRSVRPSSKGATVTRVAQ